MDVATTLALVAATLNLFTAVVLGIISRAPGWRVARACAAIALTAGLYNCSGLVFATAGLPDVLYLAAGRLAYAAGHLNTLVWLVVTFGGPDAAWASVSRAVRRVLVVSLGLACVVAISGLNLRPVVDVVDVPWAGVQYHLPQTTSFGDVYGALVLVQFAVVFVQLIRRLAGGERTLGMQVGAFAMFFVTAVLEYLVAHRHVVFVSLADLGALAIVIPVAHQVLRRFVVEAAWRDRQRDMLAGTVREQSAWRDRAQVALAESDRVAALGRMAAGVGHEINNPLTYLTLSLGEIDAYLASTGAPADVTTALAHARDGATRIQRVAERLRTYSHRHDERLPTDLRDVVAAGVRVAGPSIDPSTRVSFAFDAAPRVMGDESRLVQAFVNVLVNAAQAVRARPGAGAIRVSVASNPSGAATLTVEDDGVGVSPEHVGRLGEPYFTTRADQGGLGLGLFVTRGIVDAHGGSLQIRSTPGAGTVARLVFPGLREPAGGILPLAVPPAPAAPAAPAPRASADIVPFPGPTAGPRPSVLIVDDEPLITKLLATILQRTWAVSVAEKASDALEQLAAQRFDAAVCGLMMPGMSGIDLADHLAVHDTWHRSRMLFLTGGAVTPEAEAFLERPDVRHLMKPVSRADLLEALATCRAQPSRETGQEHLHADDDP